MVDADGPRQPLEVLRNAARGGQERFLVALGDGVERPRIVGALNSEGFVLEVESVPEGLARLADEAFDPPIPGPPAHAVRGGPRGGGGGGRGPAAGGWSVRRWWRSAVMTGVTGWTVGTTPCWRRSAPPGP